MTNPVMVLNREGDRGRLKASILCDALLHAGVTFTYALIGDCHTVTVAESDVSKLRDLGF